MQLYDSISIYTVDPARGGSVQGPECALGFGPQLVDCLTQIEFSTGHFQRYIWYAVDLYHMFDTAIL
jgi:hypothetical protein